MNNLLRRFTDFILQNRLQAMGVAFLCAYVPLIGSISILIAGLVTLRKGAKEGAIVLFAATLPYVLSYLATKTPAHELEIAFIFGIIILSNCLVWLFSLLLRRYNNWALVLEYAILLSIVFIGLLHLMYPDVQDWWAIQLARSFEKTTSMISGLQGYSEGLSKEAQVQVIGAVKNYATGLLITPVLLYTLLQVLLARWWQAILYNPGGLRKELHHIRLSHVMGIIFIVVFALSYWGSTTAMDMMPILFAMFCISGLSLVHCLLATVKWGWVWLLFLYASAIWLFPTKEISFCVVIISALALLDIWIDFRKRFARPV